ncbi:unnamed protein product [Linum trigynum]|uniref:Uncharacterized protein n=1 Tax=Linum trigynum TaxID=586398 RepID=A0AAV2FE07_9ROSI
MRWGVVKGGGGGLEGVNFGANLGGFPVDVGGEYVATTDLDLLENQVGEVKAGRGPTEVVDDGVVGTRGGDGRGVSSSMRRDAEKEEEDERKSPALQQSTEERGRIQRNVSHKEEKTETNSNIFCI